MASVSINNQTYAPLLNPNANRSALEHLVEANKSSYMSYRMLQLLERCCKAASLAFDSVSEFFSALGSKLLTAWTWLIIPRLPEVTQKAWKAITTWGTIEGPEGHALRSHIKGINVIADFSASWCYAGSLVVGGSLKNVGDVLDLGSHITDTAMSAEEVKMAGDHLEHIRANHANNEALIERFSETKKEALLRLVKGVLSVVSTTLGLLVLFFGGPILPPAALLGISLSTTLVALGAYFYKETATYKPVKFFEWAQPAGLDGVRVN